MGLDHGVWETSGAVTLLSPLKIGTFSEAGLVRLKEMLTRPRNI